MTHKIPTGGFRGTERADQTDDPSLPRGERGLAGGGPTPAPRPGPWLVLTLLLAATLVAILALALVTGVGLAIR